jgi:MFS family permease
MATSFDPEHPVFRVRPIKPEEVPWMLQRNIWTGVLGHISVNFLTGGVLFTAYCQAMGMQDYQFGLLSTLVAATTPLMLLAASIEERFGRRKYPWFMAALLSRLLLGVLILGLFMRVHPWAIIALLVAAMSLARLVTPLWESWTWDYVPVESFGRFWARRTVWTTMGGMAFAIFGAAIVGLAPQQHQLYIICPVFGLLVAMGIVDLIYHVQIPEPPRTVRSAASIAKIRQCLSSAPFRNWLLVLGIWYFGVAIGGPFCLPYMLKELGFSGKIFSATLFAHVLPGVCSLIVLPRWGRLADSRHRALIVSACCACWASIPLLYYLATPANAWWTMGLAWAIGGLFPSAVSLSIPLITRRLSGEDKTMPAALQYVVIFLGYVLGSAAGTMIVGVYNVPAAFIVSFAARITGAFLIFVMLVVGPCAPYVAHNSTTERRSEKVRP